MQIDHNSSKPLHAQAEEILRNLIDSEEYKTGKYLPNEVELSQKLNISRNTLRQAINKLVFEGLLVRKKGVGTKRDLGRSKKLVEFFSRNEDARYRDTQFRATH